MKFLLPILFLTGCSSRDLVVTAKNYVPIGGGSVHSGPLQTGKQVELFAPTEAIIYEMDAKSGEGRRVWENRPGFPFDGKRPVYLRMKDTRTLEIKHRTSDGFATETCRIAR